jgi:streptogramin lyase
VALTVACCAIPATVAASSSITEYPLASHDQNPTSITTGPDGRLWFTETSNSGLGVISTSGAFSTVPGLSAPGYGIASSAGDLWVTQPSADEIAKVAPTGSVTEYRLTQGHLPVGITAGPDGNVWFTEFSDPAEIGRITPAGASTYFGLPAGSEPSSIASGPDGNLWFTDYGNPGGIGRITPSGTITVFTAGLTADGHPASVTAGPDGNLWFTESANPGRIGRITPGGTITEFTSGLTADSSPGSITAGPNGNLWFTESAKPGRIAEITPAGAITEVATPSADSSPAGITTGPDGRIWFTETGGDGAIAAVPAPVPVATTDPAVSVAQTTATLTGDIDPDGSATTYQFEWGTSTAYGSVTPSPAATVGDDSTDHTLSASLTGLAPDTVYHYRIVATDCAGCASGTSYGADVSFVTSAPVLEVRRPTVVPPVPTIGKTANLVLTSGDALVRTPGSKDFKRFGASALVPVSSVIDVTHGFVRLTTALVRPGDHPVRTQSVRIWGGRFSFHQTTRSGKVTLELTQRPSCKRRSAEGRSARVAGHTTQKRRATKLPTLWAHDNHGKYSTRGLNSVATVRGTIWKTVNTCAGTLTYVKQGVVSVRNLHTGRAELVRAGHQLLVANASNAPARHQ